RQTFGFSWMHKRRFGVGAPLEVGNVKDGNRSEAMRSLPQLALIGLGMLCLRAAADPWPIGPPDPIQLMEMTLIKGGCYKMGNFFGDGAEDEKPVHEVCVKDFYIGKYPVTQMQWTGTMGRNPSRESQCGMTCPVENVSWNEVQE